MSWVRWALKGFVGLVLGCYLASSAWAQGVQVQVQDGSGQPLEGAVVFLDSPDAARRVRPVMGAEVVQQNKAFAPSVLVVTRGTSVQFPNKDTVRHHVYSFSPAKKFELKLYVGTPANPVQFDQPGVVVLGCNIHDHMVGWILVVDTPHHAQTRSDGVAVLDAVPRGDHVLRVWHSRLPVGAEAQAQRIKLGDGQFSTTVVLKEVRP
jgi:plastocyanin